MRESFFTVASMGHPQHGKSSLLGCIAMHFRGEERLELLLSAIEEKVKELGSPELRYSLVFDLPKNDFSFREIELKRDPTKTTSRLPGWIGCRIGGSRVMLVDEPGHPQFLKYVVAPSARADVGILVVEALAFQDEHQRTVSELGENCFTQLVETRGGQVPLLLKLARDERNAIISHPKKAALSKRKYWVPQACVNIINYLTLCELFSIKHVVVAIHKLDKAGFSQEIFTDVKDRLLNLTSFVLRTVDLQFVPTAVLAGQKTNHNVTKQSPLTSWYSGPTIADKLLEYSKNEKGESPSVGPLRLQVERIAQASRKTGYSPPPRIFGRVDSGTICNGDTIVFTPSGLSARVKTIRLRDESRFFSASPYWNEKSWEVDKAGPGTYVSIALAGKEIDNALKLARQRIHWQGQIMSHPHDIPSVSKKMRVRLQIVPPWWIEEQMKGIRLIYGYERVNCCLPWTPGHQESWWENMTVDINCERKIAVDIFRAGGGLGKIVLECDGYFVAGGNLTEIL